MRIFFFFEIAAAAAGAGGVAPRGRLLGSGHRPQSELVDANILQSVQKYVFFCCLLFDCFFFCLFVLFFFLTFLFLFCLFVCSQ